MYILLFISKINLNRLKSLDNEVQTRNWHSWMRFRQRFRRPATFCVWDICDRIVKRNWLMTALTRPTGIPFWMTFLVTMDWYMPVTSYVLMLNAVRLRKNRKTRHPSSIVILTRNWRIIWKINGVRMYQVGRFDTD